MSQLDAVTTLDPQALFAEYHQRLYRYTLSLLHDPAAADDAAQETFVRATRQLESLRDRQALTAWLYRIATNEALMTLRRKRPDTISFDEPLADEAEPQEPLQIVDWCCMPEEELMSAEGRTYLDKAVESLPTSLRVVFLLRDIEGLSTRETAEVLNLSEMAVKTRLSRARLQLRETLSTYYSERLIG